MGAQWAIELRRAKGQPLTFGLPAGSYRVIVRAEDTTDATLQMGVGGGRLLGDEAQQITEAHIARRGGTDPATRMQVRSRKADIELDDPGASRTHAMIFCGTHGLSIADLMSTNGTQVNGQTLSDADLEAGDEIGIGQTTLRVLRRDAPEA